jgi:hypothetical protein
MGPRILSWALHSQELLGETPTGRFLCVMPLSSGFPGQSMDVGQAKPFDGPCRSAGPFGEFRRTFEIFITSSAEWLSRAWQVAHHTSPAGRSHMDRRGHGLRAQLYILPRPSSQQRLGVVRFLPISADTRTPYGSPPKDEPSDTLDTSTLPKQRGDVSVVEPPPGC